MSVSVSMPQLGESVTEGTVTRWLKREGDHVSADEPLLEVSTDKVDTEIPSPVSGILRGITVAEDETVAVGAELAVIDEDGAASTATAHDASGGQPAAAEQPAAYQSPEYPEPAPPVQPAAHAGPSPYPPSVPSERPAYEPAVPSERRAYEPPAYAEPALYQPPAPPERPVHEPPAYVEPAPYQPSAPPERPVHEPPAYVEPAPYQPSAYPEPAPYQPPAYPEPPAQAGPEASQPPAYLAPPAAAAGPLPGYAEPPGPAAAHPDAAPGEPGAMTGPAASAADGPYVTPLVRKLAAEHDIDLGTIAGTGVGGRIRKQDVLDAARTHRAGDVPRQDAGAVQPERQAPSGPSPGTAPSASPATAAGEPAGAAAAAAVPSAVPAGVPAPSPARPSVTPASQRGTTERLSRARQVIAQRMVESLQTSAQLTTVVEADVTAIARLRDRARAAFEAREGVKLTFLPFFAQATVEALKIHPRLNAVVDVSAGTVTYHDAEHLGIAVDTERGLMVPVIRNAGDLNIGGLARKIADLAQRTRAGQVSPDDLTGGTFTLTNTGSRGALFDTPIINIPQAGILGTGTVNRRAVVMDDPALGEVITVRSMVYLALTYDHRLVDGADAARFLVTIRSRLEEGAFEAELGL